MCFHYSRGGVASLWPSDPIVRVRVFDHWACRMSRGWARRGPPPAWYRRSRALHLHRGGQKKKQKFQHTPGGKGKNLAWTNEPCSKCSGSQCCANCKDEMKRPTTDTQAAEFRAACRACAIDIYCHMCCAYWLPSYLENQSPFNFHLSHSLQSGWVQIAPGRCAWFSPRRSSPDTCRNRAGLSPWFAPPGPSGW